MNTLTQAIDLEQKIPTGSFAMRLGFDLPGESLLAGDLLIFSRRPPQEGSIVATSANGSARIARYANNEIVFMSGMVGVNQRILGVMVGVYREIGCVH